MTSNYLIFRGQNWLHPHKQHVYNRMPDKYAALESRAVVHCIFKVDM